MWNEMFTKINSYRSTILYFTGLFAIGVLGWMTITRLKSRFSTDHYPIYMYVTSVSDQRNRQIMLHMLNRIIQTSGLTTHNQGTSYIYRLSYVLIAWLGNAKSSRFVWLNIFYQVLFCTLHITYYAGRLPTNFIPASSFILTCHRCFLLLSCYVSRILNKVCKIIVINL